MNKESALRSAVSIFQEYGIWMALLAFILVLTYGIGKKHRENNPIEKSQRELTKEEHIKEGNQELIGWIIGILLIVGLTWLLI